MSTIGKGYKADTTWIAEIADHKWHRYEDETRTLVIKEARERARLEGCLSVTIFSIPDPFFPINGNTSRRRVYAEQLNTPSAKYDIKTTYRAEIQPDVWQSTPEHLRPVLLQKIRDDLNELGLEHPGRYQILLCEENENCRLIERGRV